MKTTNKRSKKTENNTAAPKEAKKILESTETTAEEETKLTLGEKIGFGILLTLALPIIFYPFTFFAILYWAANPFNFESVAKFIFMMIAIAGTLFAFKIMSGEVEVKPKDKSKNE